MRKYSTNAPFGAGSEQQHNVCLAACKEPDGQSHVAPLKGM